MFSQAGAVLDAAPVLEDPEEFQDWMQDRIKPSRGRLLHVEVLKQTLNWQEFFGNIDMQVKGLTPTHWEPHACHSWRLVARSAVSRAFGAVDCMHVAWGELPQDGDDTVLLLKRFMASSDLAQKPLLLMPSSVMASLQPCNLTLAPQIDLGDRARDEFKKTANIVKQPPWNLLRAAEYLETLVADNMHGKGDDVPANLKPVFVFHHRVVARVSKDPLSLPLQEPSGDPRYVSVAKGTRKRQKLPTLDESDVVYKRPAGAVYRRPASLSCVSPAADEPHEAQWRQLIMAEAALAEAEEAGEDVELLCSLEEAGQDKEPHDRAEEAGQDEEPPDEAEEAGQDEEPPEEAEEARQADEGGGTSANVTEVMISKQNYMQGKPRYIQTS